MAAFRVERKSRSYVPPSSSTPSGFLELSSIDRDEGLRHMVRTLHVFLPRHHQDDEGLHSGGGGGKGLSPAPVVREALGKALVDYYPLAGRLVDGPEGPASVRVECTGEGAWFVEAAAGCTLADVACLDQLPFLIPADDLLPDAAPGVRRQVDVPLMVQVTEFACGGFVVGLSSSHTVTDGLGAGQFITAVADYARGVPKPRVTPVWARELVPSPPRPNPGPPPYPRMLQLRYLTADLSSDGISAAKSEILASTGQRCSTFDVAVAKLWQARTRALRLADNPSAQVTLCFFANVRHLLPADGGAGAPGFYGNCFYPVTLAAEARAVAELAGLGGVVAMVREAKARLPAEFARWAAGELEEDPFRLRFTYESVFVADWTRLGFMEVDYGWGAPSHVVPLAPHPCMPIARIGAPPALRGRVPGSPRTASRRSTCRGHGQRGQGAAADRVRTVGGRGARGGPLPARFTHESVFVADWTRLGFMEVDYGWGAPSHVVPLAPHPCMPIARIGAPPVPRTGAGITTYCVEEEHLPGFREEMQAFGK
ncbi:hypothetical protein U9M48_005093 [Paspalum notatum var. saurae]|uniref:Uncharacterized protein n=1 Tax=Paspalum notatum var. saurae TaxID=547442 RepID=A0AAQ3PUQ6_PASNO